MSRPEEELVALAERVVEKAAGRRGVAEAEAFLVLDRDLSVQVEKNITDQAMVRESYGIAIRVLAGGRIGFAYATSQDRVGEAIDAAMQASRHSKRFRFTFPRPRKAPTVSGLWDGRVGEIDADRVVADTQAVIDAVQAVEKGLNAAGGGVSVGLTWRGLANSEGVAVTQRETGVSMSCYVVRDGGAVSTGSAHRSSHRLDVKPDAVGGEAARLAVASARPTALARGGRMDVVIRPEAAAELLTTITLASLSGRAAHRQESYYSGKMGRSVAAKGFGLVEDPTVAGGLGSGPTDDEGVPSRRVGLISRGVLKSFLFDTSTACEYKARSTASAVRTSALDGSAYKAPPSVASRQVEVVSPRTTTERLLASIDEGVLVHDVMGTHTANTVSGDFGVTSSLLFRIQDGEVLGPAAPVSISGNIHRSLQAGLRLGDDVRHIDVGVGFRLPSVLFRGLTVTP